MQQIEGKPQIDYPTQWEYRIIGKDKQELQKIVEEIFPPDYNLKDGQASSSGKFVSIVVSVEVSTQEQRNDFFAKLKNHPQILMVL
ncbi:DUF493 domain-containing protein [Helicobacter cholecystus]|uniref:DUF493 domain-containing protein n=1 Tax=Helicobacter cholecystus TaxID=45498 RepID=A0A3D8IY33_9HELI|nr:DUF493 domain-containing protein [Helicobacter cholecystus]RDU69963.1 DUF493 domain-containing protein [Helicobacter cholecystus]VEJ24870.1 Uncharacterized conserved protein [Helicobacter cholecystus]